MARSAPVNFITFTILAVQLAINSVASRAASPAIDLVYT